VWLTRAGPYHNPQESYSYYSLPFCAPIEPLQPQHRFAGLGEVFEGTEWVNSDLVVRFGVDQPPTAYCSMVLGENEAGILDYAVANHFIYQMTIDELPVWGMVGEVVTGEQALEHLRQHGETVLETLSKLGPSESVGEVSRDAAVAMSDHAFIFTHKRFSIGFNGNRIVEVNLTSDAPQHIEAGRSFDLSYSVQWVPTDRPFDKRFDRYLDVHFFEHHVHWFALMNSFLTVAFVACAVLLILGRTVRSQIQTIVQNYAMQEEMDEEAGGLADPSGAPSAAEASWKLLHGDVFRMPAHPEFFAALLGTGVQLAIMGMVIVVIAAVRAVVSDRGYTTTAVVAVYALTSAVAGYVSASWYRYQFLPKPSARWQFVMFLTASLLPCTAVAMLGPLNAIAWRASTINTISAGNVVTLALLWVCVSLPLCVVGTLLGRRSTSVSSKDRPGTLHKPRVNIMPRPLPLQQPWYAHPLVLIALGGFPPFGCIFVEAYFVLSSFWGYTYYYLFGFLGLVLAMLAIVTACSSVVVTYVALSHEDHRWPWLTFCSGASMAGYLFLYSLYYFVAKTEMHGLVQTAFFFSYSGLICISMGIGCGAIAFFASAWFVRTIYADVKTA
jgi:transmembrane 9 superfamily member 3